MEFREALGAVVKKQDLSGQDAEELMRFLVSGEATDAQIGGALAALASKGAAARELAGFAKVLREKALTVKSEDPNVVDTCGTGGGIPSFNISTAAAIIAAAAGARVAKHGNRGVTSACGSADVLEALGARIDGDPEQALHLLDSVGLAFFFAPAFHPAMKAVGKVRRELGVRTVFNQLGPLVNPAGARRQLIGVFDPSLLRPMAEALAATGTERALLVHGQDGLDELSPCGPTSCVKVWDGSIEDATLSPEVFDCRAAPSSAILPADSVQENGMLLMEAISDPDSPRCHAALPSAAAALWLYGQAEDAVGAGPLALEAVSSGAARRKMSQFIEASQG